ncbi:hypothetical protein ACHMWN_14815 [Pedobacter sp. UC225_61]|uniref:hypothetical protein n=1 Tax=Pedobacter sp. UC225_61 TaxID=3374623 RepID=UPI0037B7FFDF
MENQDNTNQQQGSSPNQKGSSVPIAIPQGKNPTVKEGDPNQQRPKYGSKGGPNTSTREDQLPSLENPSEHSQQGE